MTTFDEYLDRITQWPPVHLRCSTLEVARQIKPRASSVGSRYELNHLVALVFQGQSPEAQADALREASLIWSLYHTLLCLDGEIIAERGKQPVSANTGFEPSAVIWRSCDG